MRTRLTLRPGQRGTKRLLAEHGERLVCVRYRYDDVRRLRIKTVELVVEERPWVYSRPVRFLPPERRVLVALCPGDRPLREEVRAAGGIWRPEHGAWEMPHAIAERLGVAGLVVVERVKGQRGRGPWREKSPRPGPHLRADAR